nr:ArsR family transcriptional regulator [Frankia sp. R43]
MLGHPVRIRVLELLVDGPKPVRDLLIAIEVEPPNPSQHLAVLRHSGVGRGGGRSDERGTADLAGGRPDCWNSSVKRKRAAGQRRERGWAPTPAAMGTASRRPADRLRPVCLFWSSRRRTCPSANRTGHTGQCGHHRQLALDEGAAGAPNAGPDQLRLGGERASARRRCLQ